MNLTLITPTGERPQAFALCEKWMQSQTVQPFQWLVLDDGVPPCTCTLGQDYHYWPAMRGAGSLVNKIAFAFERKLIKGDAVAFIEDDDYYFPHYLETLVQRLEQGLDMAGEGRALYYNVEKRWWTIHGNMQHASLCQTGLRQAVYPKLQILCRQTENAFLDTRIWNTPMISKKRIFDPADKPSAIGIKSMPGRSGYGVGHTINRVGRYSRPVNNDPDLAKLAALIGSADAEEYRAFQR